MSFLVTNPHQFGPNLHQIPWRFHVIDLCLFSMLGHDMDFGQVQVREFPWRLLRKWWDFRCGFDLIFDQTVVKNTWGNPCHIFYRGVIFIHSKISITHHNPQLSHVSSSSVHFLYIFLLCHSIPISSLSSQFPFLPLHPFVRLSVCLFLRPFLTLIVLSRITFSPFFFFSASWLFFFFFSRIHPKLQ